MLIDLTGGLIFHKYQIHPKHLAIRMANGSIQYTTVKNLRVLLQEVDGLFWVRPMGPGNSDDQMTVWDFSMQVRNGGEGKLSLVRLASDKWAAVVTVQTSSRQVSQFVVELPEYEPDALPPGGEGERTSAWERLV